MLNTRIPQSSYKLLVSFQWTNNFIHKNSAEESEGTNEFPKRKKRLFIEQCSKVPSIRLVSGMPYTFLPHIDKETLLKRVSLCNWLTRRSCKEAVGETVGEFWILFNVTQWTCRITGSEEYYEEFYETSRQVVYSVYSANISSKY